MYILAKRLLGTYKRYKVREYQSARVLIALAEIKTLNSLHIIKLGQRYYFLLFRLVCRAFFERNQTFFAQSFSLRRLCTVYTVPLYNSPIIEVFSKTDQCSHLGKAIDTLIIW